MDDPTRLELSDPSVRQVGSIFGAPLVVKGFSAFPLTQLVVWALMTWRAARQDPSRTASQRLSAGLLYTVVLLGSEWGHNIAHAAAARAVGKPMQLIRILAGMPRIQYPAGLDPSVLPRQHLLRALGGPLFNACMLPLAALWRRFSRPGSAAQDAASLALDVNAFIGVVGLAPLPMIDGGPVLKWSLVARGRTPSQADEIVRRVDGALVPAFAGAGLLAFARRRRFAALVSLLMALTSFACWRGWLKG